MEAGLSKAGYLLLGAVAGGVILFAQSDTAGVKKLLATDDLGNVEKEERLARVSLSPNKPIVIAAGKVAAMSEVTIGSEISGRISKVLVDINDKVSAGQTIALVDDTEARYQLEATSAQVKVAQAELERANAAIAQFELDIELQRRRTDEARLSVDEAEVRLKNAEIDSESADKLRANKVISDRDFRAIQLNRDLQQASLNAARAKVMVSQAELSSAEQNIRQLNAARDTAIAVLAQRDADVSAAQVALDRTVIRSPITGIVLARRVEAGQVISARMETPELFIVAPDLEKIKVVAAVSEADIMRLRLTTSAKFSVDAWPGEEFGLKVQSISKYPRKHDAVVLYDVSLTGDNPGGKLVPGMTATVSFFEETGRLLQIPSSTLTSRADQSGSVLKKEDGRHPQRIAVTIIKDDGAIATINAPQLRAGDVLIVP